MSRTEQNQPWHITQRWQQYEGEARANLLRIIAIGTFYLIHLWTYFSSQGKLPEWGFLQLAGDAEIDRRFHVMVTLLALAWTMTAFAVHFALRQRYFPRWLSVASTLCDAVFLTSVLSISSGPRSPMVVGYFLIIILAALRLSLPLVRLATVASAIGYIVIQGVAKWPETFGHATGVNLQVPRYHQLVVLVAIALSGILVGQIVRRTRRMAEDYAQRLSRQDGSQP